MIRSDNHVHTRFSTDSKTPMEEMVKEAIRRGLSSICFTDHMDYDFPDLGKGVEFLFDVDEYFSELSALQTQYPQIEIRQGIELGLKADLKEKCDALIQSYPFDFVIGSTHLVDNMDPYYPQYWEGLTDHEGIRRYYETTLENIKTHSCFDVYGHIDYIIRYTPIQKENRRRQIIDEAYMDMRYQECADIIDEILKLLIEKGKGIELNTSGLKYGLGHPHPQEKILKRYHELGGQIITIGSDGHEPAHLAYDFDRVPGILRSCGFDYYTEFHQRKPRVIQLSAAAPQTP